jgi:phospholipid/cholesterol/gamma-HCH transport system substrate-binding protein
MAISRLVKIALFFIALGGAGVTYIVATADGMSAFNTKVYEAVMEDASGLTTRSKIFLAGVVVGKVKEIKLVDDGALVKISFLKNVSIREDSRIARKSSSILGTSLLVLEPGSESSPVVSPGGRLGVAKDSGDISAVIGTVSGLGDQITSLIRNLQENQLALLSVSLESINAIVAKVNEQSDAELERVARILESVALVAERIERIMAQGELGGEGPVADVYAALENIRGVSEEISAGRGTLGRAVYGEDLYNSILATIKTLESVSGQMNTAMRSINNAASGVESVVNTANNVIGKAAGTGVQVETSASYLFSANQASENRVMAGASLRLVPSSPDRWYRVGVSSAPVTSRIVRETSGGTQPSPIEDVTETNYSSFAVDAEFARTFGMLTVRGGLLESTVGLGLDFQPIRWIGASAEIFNFLSGGVPNLRGTLTVYPFFDPNSDKPWNWLYIKGGINDSLKDSRAFFVGGGIRFTAD